MTGFRLFLIAVLAVIAVYTAIVGLDHGWNLLPVFFGDMMALTWPGQFNLDFFCFLLLAGLWLAWRHDFSPAGFALGLAGVFGGMFFLSAYLLVATARSAATSARSCWACGAPLLCSFEPRKPRMTLPFTAL